MAVTPNVQKLIDAQIFMEDHGILIPGAHEEEYKFNTAAVNALSSEQFKDLQETLSGAGLYVPEGHRYFRDGSMGGMTEHAMRLAGNPQYAEDYITQTAFTDAHLTNREIMFLQTSLNRMGYGSDEPITVDGKFGKQTTAALKSFLEENPGQIDNIAPSLKARMLKFMSPEDAQVFTANIELPRPRPDRDVAVETVATPDVVATAEIDATTEEPAQRRTITFTEDGMYENGVLLGRDGKPVPFPMPAEMRPASVTVDSAEIVRSYVQKGLEGLNETGGTLPAILHPGVVVLMERDPSYTEVVAKALIAGEEAGIDPVKYANQVYLESSYDANATSNRGAYGPVQMTPSTGAHYDLNSIADLRDFDKALPAGAKHMADMIEEYASYEGAMVSYIAGEGGRNESFALVANSIGVENPTMEQWISFNLTRQAAEDDKDSSPNAWHNAGVDYVMAVNPSTWTPERWERELDTLKGAGTMPPEIAARFAAQDQTPIPVERSDTIIALQNGLNPEKPSLATLMGSEIFVPSIGTAPDPLLATLQQGLAEMKNTNDSQFNSIWRTAYDLPLMSTPQNQSFIPQDPEAEPRVLQSKAVLTPN